MFRKNPFKGFFVQITTKTKIAGSYANAQNEPIKTMMPLTLHGYLIYDDKDNYYVGDTKNEVSFFIAKNDVLLVEKLMEKKQVVNKQVVAGEGFDHDDQYFQGSSLSKLDN